jgi:hypothetical protein
LQIFVNFFAINKKVCIFVLLQRSNGLKHKIMTFLLIEAASGTGMFQVQQGAGTVIGQFESIEEAEMAFEARMREILSESEAMRHSDLFLLDESRNRV